MKKNFAFDKKTPQNAKNLKIEYQQRGVKLK